MQPGFSGPDGRSQEGCDHGFGHLMRSWEVNGIDPGAAGYFPALRDLFLILLFELGAFDLHPGLEIIHRAGIDDIDLGMPDEGNVADRTPHQQGKEKGSLSQPEGEAAVQVFTYL